jgi:hypothetical protein
MKSVMEVHVSSSLLFSSSRKPFNLPETNAYYFAVKVSRDTSQLLLKRQD